MGARLSRRPNDELTVVNPPTPLIQENNLSTAVEFGKPFLLRWEPSKRTLFETFFFYDGISTPPRSSRFWRIDEATRYCDVGEITPTSLLTFHGRNADAVNVRRNVPFVSVTNNSIVNIYANVGTGRYLTQEETGLKFIRSPPEVRSNPVIAASCEFLIRRSSMKVSDQLNFGENIYLESASNRGNFLSIRYQNGIGTLVVGPFSKERCKFVLHSPTLRELVQLHATGVNLEAPKDDVSEDREPSVHNDFELEEIRIEAEREKQFMAAFAQAVPVELAKRVFEFHHDWLRIARLVCKQWQIVAEKSIRRIRVNGEFCSLETPEERSALVEFVRRCPNLEVLTLRNVMTLDDEDVAKITENRNLVRLILGGCRRLSDKSTLQIAVNLSKLNHLNMAFTSITDESLRIVSERVEQLKELNLYNCSGVTVEGINRTVDGLAALEHINLRGTVVDSHLVNNFRKKRPKVVVLTGPASSESIWG